VEIPLDNANQADAYSEEPAEEID